MIPKAIRLVFKILSIGLRIQNLYYFRFMLVRLNFLHILQKSVIIVKWLHG